MMKVLLACLSLWLTGYSSAPENPFEFDKIRFRGIGFATDKQTILNAFGKPAVNYPKYECGFYEDSQPNGPYYQFIYDGFNFIGSDKENFILEVVQFDPAGKMKLQYGVHEISG